MVARRSATARSNSLATPTLLIIDGSGPGIAMEPSWRAVRAAAASAASMPAAGTSVAAPSARTGARRCAGAASSAPASSPIATRGRLAPPAPSMQRPACRVPSGIPASARTSADPARRRVPHRMRPKTCAEALPLGSLSLCAREGCLGEGVGGARVAQRLQRRGARATGGAHHRGQRRVWAGAGGAAPRWAMHPHLDEVAHPACVEAIRALKVGSKHRRRVAPRCCLLRCAAPPCPALRRIMRADSLLRPSRRATRVARGESSSASATARTPRWPGALRLSGCRHALTTMPEPASGVRGRSRRGPPQRRLRRRRGDVPAGAARRAHTYTPTSQTQTRAHADSRTAPSHA